MSIGEKLKQCRAHTKLTQADVASKMHLSRKTISGWETGRNYPDIGSLIQLSDIYQVSLEDLVRDDRMLEHFDEQRKSSVREERILLISYWANIALLVLEIIHVIHPTGQHMLFIPILLFGNLILYFSHFDNWHRFKNTFYTVRTLVTFAILFTIASVGGLMNSEFINAFTGHDDYYVSGMMMAMIISGLLLAMSATVAIFFRRASS